MHKTGPVVLMILDGWGYCENSDHNAIAQANTPHWDTWWHDYPHALLAASGSAVGLPAGQMGNSEVGHMHIGAGRVINQDLTRIQLDIQKHKFAQNTVLIQALNKLKHTSKAIHVMGLLSPGGVHSHEDHLFAFLDMCADQKFTEVYLHLFLDGRDTPPQSAISSLDRLQNYLKHTPVARICSISGRYYAMDRDQRWDRTAAVYQLIISGKSNHHALNAIDALNKYYMDGIYDEFVPPTQIGSAHAIEDGDILFCFNFRADRVRQLTAALIQEDFTGFKRHDTRKLNEFISMTSYAKSLATTCVFPQQELQNTFGEVIAQNGLRQLRLAETEKYAHVTFFFNGGNEEVFPHEDRLLIPSPKVATYDLAPEMSAKELTSRLIEMINQHTYDVIICNYANADMLGHTGNFAATIAAIETLDQSMYDVWQALEKNQGYLFITADHGNAESMFDPQTQQPHTAHTLEPVPFLYVGNDLHVIQDIGNLSDIAPTLLTLLGIQPPKEMTGKCLMERI